MMLFNEIRAKQNENRSGAQEESKCISNMISNVRKKNTFISQQPGQDSGQGFGETLDIIRDDGIQAQEYIERDEFIETFIILYFGPADEQIKLLFNM